MELEEAIYDYLCSQGARFSSTKDSFKSEAGIKEGTELGRGQLEKKWVSVLRLQVCRYKIKINLSFLQASYKIIEARDGIGGHEGLWGISSIEWAQWK